MKARREEIVIRGEQDQARSAGELRIQGLRTAEDRGEIMSIVASAARQAEQRNSEAKVAGLSLAGETVVVSTTDGKLAESLGKRIHRSRKGGQLTITWSDRDVPVRVVWQAPKHKAK